MNQSKMDEEKEFRKLSIIDRCVHKSWKVRFDGYDEVLKVFRSIDDEMSPEWNEYLSLIRNFVTDGHAMAQERGLEATLMFVKKAACAGKIAGEVMFGLVEKCLSASKTKVKEMVLDITLTYIEIGKHEATVGELVRATEVKNPKIVATSISLLTRALHEFGHKVIGIKVLTKKIPLLLGDRDANVREEAKLLTIELNRWIGDALKPHIASLPTVLLIELENEFSKWNGEKMQPTRRLRSKQQNREADVIGDGNEPTVTDADDCNNNQEDIDPLDLIDPIDILSTLSTDFYAKMESNKWQDRKAALEALHALLQQPKFKSGDGDYAELMNALKMVLTKDSNVILVAMAAKCIACLAKGLHKSFAPYAAFSVSCMLEKFKEKKSNVVLALREAINAIYLSTTLESIQVELLEGLKNKNPSIKAETASFLTRAFAQTNSADRNKKVVKALSTALVKTLNESDFSVRETSAEALGALLNLVGDKMIAPFLSDIDPLKMAKIKEYSKKLVISHLLATPVNAFEMEKSVQRPLLAVEQMSVEKKSVAKKSKVAVKSTSAVKTSSTGRDISKQITEALLAELSDKNSKTRNDGLSKMQRILDDAQSIKPSIGELPEVLAHRLIDSNAKIAQHALEVCKRLAESMGPECKQHVRTLFPGILSGLGDSKGFIRAASITCMNAWGDRCGYKEFFDCEMIATALSNGSPALKMELWAWLKEKLPQLSPKSIPKNEIVACLPFLYANLCDRHPQVRKNANEVVAGFMLHVGYEQMLKAMEKQKPTSKKTIQEILDKARHNLPINPLPNVTKSKTVGAAKELFSQREEEIVDTLPLLPLNNLKQQRMLDEQNSKSRKWSFSMSRDDLVQMLREQMSAAGFNKNLLTNMFHVDSRYHLKAIESLHGDVAFNPKSLICNLDLILKWISLRLHDPNPTVSLQALVYLKVVLQMLATREYNCTEGECNCFLPQLLTKLGDPKDSVRYSVRMIFRQICLTYPYSMVFVCFMDGLKSKSTCQRTECLDELTHLIETYGLSAFRPTPQSALKEITRHISDRDQSVRNAALNFCARAHYLFEDGIYKMIGKLSQKDRTMLDERIQRAKKKVNELIETDSSEHVPCAIGEQLVPSIVEETENTQEQRDQATDVPSTTELFNELSNETFKLDDKYINDIKQDWTRSDVWAMGESTRFLQSPLKNCEANEVRLMQEPSTGPISSCPVSKLNLNLVQMCRKIGISDPVIAKSAINELNDLLERPESSMMQDYEELYIENVCLQFKHLSSWSMSDASGMCEALLTNLHTFYTIRPMVRNVGATSLKTLMASIVRLLADQKSSMDGHNRYAGALNRICSSILKKSNYTHIICALLRLLTETCSSNLSAPPNFTELLLKCIWRNTKDMPEKANDINYDAILLEMYEFMVTIPQSWWQKNPQLDDSPIRTVKTMLYTFVNIKGVEILNHMTEIPTDSELCLYLRKCLKNNNMSRIERNSSSVLSATVSNDDKNSDRILTENRMTEEENAKKDAKYWAERLNKIKARCNKANDGILCGDNGAAMENFIVHEVVKQGDPSNKEVPRSSRQDILARYAQIRSQK